MLRNYGPRPTRGNSYDRRKRKNWLLNTFGDGRFVDCYRCGKQLRYESLTVDRVIMGCDGGSYRRDNIRPACLHCNSSTGGAVGNERRWQKTTETGSDLAEAA